MLSLQDFNHLTHVDKMGYLKKWGTYLAIRRTSVFEIKLYYLHDFFVELYCRPHYDTCEYIGNFKDITMLDPYLNKITIDIDC
ncbi:MAG: hypothetical protein M3Q05_04620 [Bacteroidota bacterium]|nr:hypothetical protein [Bacteroidota bacterium]